MTDLAYAGKTVLVTGGTKGIGRAIALEFARHGADVWVTHKWGSVEPDELAAIFEAGGAKTKPNVVQADVTSDEDTDALLAAMKERTDGVEAFISNVAFAQLVSSPEEYKKRSFLKSIEYSAWPFAAYPNAIHATFGRYPRYVLGISSHGAEAYHLRYDLAAISKSVMETMVKYLAVKLWAHGTRVNVLRPWVLRTEASVASFGEEVLGMYEALYPDRCRIAPEDVAKSAYGLCSGYFDQLSGQVVSIDAGGVFMDNLMGLLERPGVAEALAKLREQGERDDP